MVSQPEEGDVDRDLGENWNATSLGGSSIPHFSLPSYSPCMGFLPLFLCPPLPPLLPLQTQIRD